MKSCQIANGFAYSAQHPCTHTNTHSHLNRIAKRFNRFTVTGNESLAHNESLLSRHRASANTVRAQESIVGDDDISAPYTHRIQINRVRSFIRTQNNHAQFISHRVEQEYNTTCDHMWRMNVDDAKNSLSHHTTHWVMSLYSMRKWVENSSGNFSYE